MTHQSFFEPFWFCTGLPFLKQWYFQHISGRKEQTRKGDDEEEKKDLHYKNTLRGLSSSCDTKCRKANYKVKVTTKAPIKSSGEGHWGHTASGSKLQARTEHNMTDQ